MSPHTPSSRFRLRHKLAAFGVVGVALCLLPLWQLWNWHGLELQWALQEAKAAEPGLLAVETQRALLQHQLASARVLQREPAAEPVRRAQQALVDDQLAQLARVLEPSGLLPAKTELQAMQRDWPPLVDRVAQQRCSVSESNHGHRLLQEQALQIIDIVSASLPTPSDLVLAQAQQQLLQTLPRQLVAGLRTPAGGWADAAAWDASLAQAQAAWQQAGARRQAWHQGQRLLAASGLLAALATVLGGSAWLLRSLRAQRLPPAPGPALRLPAASRGNATAPAWRPSAPDGQQALRLEGQRLMQRLRGPQARPQRHPPLDAPTQPQAEP